MGWWPLMPQHIECFNKHLHYSTEVLVGMIDKYENADLLS
jgi:hypothetical protein